MREGWSDVAQSGRLRNGHDGMGRGLDGHTVLRISWLTRSYPRGCRTSQKKVLFPAPGEPQKMTSSWGLFFVNGADIVVSAVPFVVDFESSRFVRYFAGSNMCSYGSAGTFRKNSSGVWNFIPILAARSLQFGFRILWLHRVIKK